MSDGQVPPADRPPPDRPPGPEDAGGEDAGETARTGDRRPLGRALAFVSAFIRAQEIGLILLAALVGAAAGVAVMLMNLSAQWLHVVLFQLPDDRRLSAAVGLSPWLVLLVPTLGGLLVAALGRAAARLHEQSLVDPIEANALYGGRLSLTGSLVIMVQTVASNGCGASVGMEAGYTQIGSGLASRSGRWLKLRRGDLRILVAAGAAAAIAAAFGAPLAGAFYGFELILGVYTAASLLPVLAGAITGHLTALALGAEIDWFGLAAFGQPLQHDHIAFIVLGGLAAVFGIGVMRGMALCERLLRLARIPSLARPMLGGLLVGCIGLITPMALGAGHGALQVGLSTALPWQTLLLVLGLKALASVLSLGSGFRGGLFSASLFLGALLGSLYALALALLLPQYAFDPAAYAVVGMSAVAAAIVGGPVTMALLALEMTGELPITVSVLMAVSVATLAVRNFFGYSFATWRFHLRGVNLRGAHDVGWINTLIVGRLMRRNPPTAPQETTLAVFRRRFPLSGEPLVVVVDAAGRYAGIVATADAHILPPDSPKLAEDLSGLLLHKGDVLVPRMTVKDALDAFDSVPADALAVVADRESMEVVGLLTEVQALKRYNSELDRRRRESIGEL